jgi:hypothetical protein
MTYCAADIAVRRGTSIVFTQEVFNKEGRREAHALQTRKAGKRSTNTATVKHGPSFLSQDGEKIKSDS